MIIAENLHVALEALRANKLRAALTTLGIIIGTAAVIAVVSIVQGLQFMITNQLEGVGSTYMQVLPDVGFNQGPGMVARPVKLTWEDGLAIRQQVPGVRLITPILAGVQPTRYRDRRHTPDFVLGVGEAYPDVMNHTVDRGRFLSRIDVERRRKVAVVGREVVDKLRLGDHAIGSEIYVGSLGVTVIGVMEEIGSTFAGNLDDLVFVPFDTALLLFGRDAGDQVQLRLQAANADAVPLVRDGIERVLRARHNLAEKEVNDFQIFQQDEILKTVGAVLGGVTVTVGAIVSIALLVGGIGIMNIMLVSVTERTREIGLRKSVGARRMDILVQFLSEAVTLSLLGGVIGVALGYGVGQAAAALLPNWPQAHVPLWAVLLAFGFCTLVGVGFGTYPALKAARLDPIDALRYE